MRVEQKWQKSVIEWVQKSRRDEGNEGGFRSLTATSVVFIMCSKWNSTYERLYGKSKCRVPNNGQMRCEEGAAYGFLNEGP